MSGNGEAGTLDPEKLDPEVRDALRREILFLADSKRVLGIRYSDWLLGAPSIETAIAASAMAQDEWGHARLLYAMLKDFGLDPEEVEHERAASEYCCLGCLDRPFENWAEYVAAVVLVDGGLALLLEALSTSPYEPCRTRIPKMLSEEEFHGDMGRAWFRRIAGGREEGREKLREASGGFLASTLSCLAPDDGVFETLVAAGFLPRASTLRGDYGSRMAPLLDLVGIEPELETGLPEEWDVKRRRGPGGPDEETVERARGDRNRALFVE